MELKDLLRQAFRAGESHKAGEIAIFNDGLADGKPDFEKWFKDNIEYGEAELEVIDDILTIIEQAIWMGNQLEKAKYLLDKAIDYTESRSFIKEINNWSNEFESSFRKLVYDD